MNLKKALSVARLAARRAAHIQRKAYTNPHEKTLKEGHDFVTQTDLASEKIILQTLQKHFPHHAYIAEESPNSKKSLQAEYCWVIDPLDGTHCFAHSIPFFGINIALLHHGQPILAVINFPILKTEYTAIADQGTLRNGKPHTIPQTAKIKGTQLTLGASAYTLIKKLKNTAEKDFSTTPIFPSTLAMTYQILEANSTISIGHTWMIWDEAAPDLILREAGGKVTNHQGKPIQYNDISLKKQGIKIYTNPRAHKKALTYIKK